MIRFTELRVCDWRRSAALAVVVLLLVESSTASEAVRSVREGVRQYHRRNFDSAARAFDAADESLPANPVVAFDRACAQAALGDWEQANQLFQVAALSRDEQLAARAHYNLGCGAAASARALFGSRPAEVAAATRADGLRALGQAVTHYRDCLRLDADHQAARHNLEIIRLWITHMRALWAERDRRQKQQDAPGQDSPPPTPVAQGDGLPPQPRPSAPSTDEQQQDLSRRQANAILQKVRERERRHRRLQRELGRYRQSDTVERDW